MNKIHSILHCLKNFPLFLFLTLPLCTIVAREYHCSPQDIVTLKRLLHGKLEAGDTLLLADGVYEHLGEVHFTGTGTRNHPIVWRAMHPGKAVISGKLTLKVYGEHLWMEGLCFRGAWPEKHEMISFQSQKGGPHAHDCRMTNCVVDECNNPAHGSRSGQGDEYWVGLRGTNNRIDHCYFGGKRVGGLVIQVWLDELNHLNNHAIDHNIFDERLPFGGNGAEIIRIGHSWSSQLESRTKVEDNLFFRCSGENEIISVKSCHNIVRRNLFYESRGGLVCRHGHYNVIESNTFIGHGLRGTAGIRIINQGHTVYDNYVKDVADFGLLVRMGVFERPTPTTDIRREPLTSYHRVENVNIARNVFLDCTLDLGSGRGDKFPRNVHMDNNLYGGKVPQLKISRADTLLLGFRWADNRWAFADGKSLEQVPYESVRTGFTSVSFPTELKRKEDERINDCLHDAGPSWYPAAHNCLRYVDTHR